MVDGARTSANGFILMSGVSIMTSVPVSLFSMYLMKLRVVFQSARGSSTSLHSDGQEGCEDGAKLLDEAFRSSR